MVVQDEKILSAIDRIIKDVDKKYDECLVEQLVECLGIFHLFGTERSSLILDRLKFYFEHKSFLMLNQTRAFKILKSILKTMRNKRQLEKLAPLLDSFWKSIDTVILNNNTSAMAIVFDILTTIVSVDESGITWVLEREITPPIQMSIPIDDVSSLVKYYINTIKNYHTRNRAEKLLQKLIIKNSHHPLMAKIEKLVRELILDGCSIGSIIRAMDAKSHLSLHSRYKINETIKDSFMANVEKTTVDISIICKHLALTDLSRKFIIEKLRSKKRLDCIIHYITESVIENNHFEQLLLSYVLYPLLAKYSDEETQALVSSLMATRDEKDFVEWNMNSKTQILCLVKLKSIFKTEDTGLRRPLSNRTVNMIVETLSNYIKCNYSQECTGSQMKNILECCCIFDLITYVDGAYVEKRIIYKILKIMQNLLDEARYNDLTKPIVLQFIKSMLAVSKVILLGEAGDFEGKVIDVWFKVVDLGFKFEDPEFLNEFTEFFIRFYPYRSVGHENYMKLVFDHIYPKTKDTDHRELLGNLIRMLIIVDSHAGDVALEKRKMRKFHDIPIIISDIICQKWMVPTIVEKIFDQTSIHDQRDDSMTDRYLANIGSCEVREKLAKALILIVKSDSNEFTRMMSIRRLKRIARSFTEEDNLNTWEVLDKLSSTGILRILHEVMTGGSCSPGTFNGAYDVVRYIKEELLSKGNFTNEVIDPDLLSFYTANNESVEERFAKNLELCDDQVNLLSCVEDILSEFTGKGISECY